MQKKYPKVLIIGRCAWTKNESTLSSIFNNYPAEKLAYICIETREPDFDKCANHFQISEIAMVKKLFQWRLKTGNKRILNTATQMENELEKKEVSTLGWVRRHRSILFLFIREILWKMGGWKSRELNQFIAEFNPDVLFFVGDPLPLTNRMQRYLLKSTKKPAVIALMDDIWSYKNCFGLLSYLYNWLLRFQVKRLIPACSSHFVISEMMKREYDDVFNIKSEILTKGIELNNNTIDYKKLHNPIRFVYTGKLIYGRKYSLFKVAEALSVINTEEQVLAELHIYTQTEITKEIRNKLDKPGISYIHKPVPYQEVATILDESDVLLFVESLEPHQRYNARLSFSTKITDYMARGKCIFAIGGDDIAPIEYLKSYDAAVVCTTYEEIKEKVKQLIKQPILISQYAYKGYKLGQSKHGMELMNSRLMESLYNLS